MNKNPFSIYDFMGYLFPGLLMLFAAFYVVNANFNPYNIFDYEAFIGALHNSDTVSFNIEKSVVLIVIAYIIGHMVSYMSSITIEFFANRTLGYPSQYLLRNERQNYGDVFYRYFTPNSKSNNVVMRWIKILFKIILKILVLLIVFPISIMTFSWGYFLGLNDFITKPLDKYLTSSIRHKQTKLAEKLCITPQSVNEDCDYHRIVMHYVYHHQVNCQKKVDNYIALYGFLRCITLLFCLMFDALLCFAISTIDVDADVSWPLIIELVILFFIAYVMYLGFIKFYRRFTLENYMALLVDEEV